MAGIEQKFAFEKGYFALSDGTIFRPLEHTTFRWERVSRCGPSYGINWEVLYETEEGKYVQVHYKGCAEKETECDGADPANRIWHGTFGYFDIIRPFEAERFVNEMNATPTTALQKASADDSEAFSEMLRSTIAERERPSRPLEEWKQIRTLPLPPETSVHDVSYPHLAKEIYQAAVDLIHILRRPPARNIGNAPARALVHRLFASYRVDYENWWGDQDLIPPEQVAVIDLPWPAEFSSFKRAMLALQILIQEPSYCFADSGDDHLEIPYDHPLEPDYRVATDAMRKELQKIERTVVIMGRALRGMALLGRNDSLEPIEQPTLPRYVSIAVNSYNLAEQTLTILGNESVTDDVAHEWLTDNGPLEYKLPDLKSWKRYLRLGREALGIQKNDTKVGRSGRSIQSARDLK